MDIKKEYKEDIFEHISTICHEVLSFFIYVYDYEHGNVFMENVYKKRARKYLPGSEALPKRGNSSFDWGSIWKEIEKYLTIISCRKNVH